MILYRKRFLDSTTFYEYLVVYANGYLCQPDSLPERFANRTVGESEYVYGTSMIEVTSKAFDECEEMSMNKLIKGNGVWIVANDCVEKGDYAPERINGKAHYFNIPIEFMTRMNITQAAIMLRDIGPQVLYHGTADTHMADILKSGLQPSRGMLGKGVYLGTYWKATRYACLTQDYKPQDGTVMRVLAFPFCVTELPNGTWKCDCGCSMPDIADHKSILLNDIHLSQSHLKKDGRVKNEEWLIKGKTFLQQYAKVDHTTFPSPHYDPMFRNTYIK